MSRVGYQIPPRAHVPPSQPPSLYDHHSRSLSFTEVHNEERDSMSGSEDGSYNLHEASKGDYDPDEDNAALTSQSLNTDGTPKRPMNAFMIFARRRRPQVSAENQAMRTGEISKILSKEWNSMEASQKQFYQEQARVLKDNFNMKYPDYVYRRRPNNTRRKRKTDSSGQRLLDTTSNLSDDMRFDHPGDSPPGGEDFRASGVSDLHRTRGDHDAHTVDHPKFRQPTVRASPYPYPSLDSRPSNGHDSNSYPVVGGDRMLHDVSLAPSAQYTYAPAQSHGRTHAHSTPVFHQNHVNGDSMSNWHRPASWLGAEQHDRGFNLPTPKPHRSIHSPASTSALSTPSLTLPTLSSPFFPDTATQPPLSPPNLSHSMPSSYGSSHIESPALAARDYSQHGIMSQVPSNGQGYHSTGRDALIYPSPHSGGARDPSIQDFSHTPQYSAHQNSQGYWQKE